MWIQNPSPTHYKKKRLYENLNIHKLFIFNRSGICFYGKDFTGYYKMEENLVSPFITALMSFSKEMIGKKFRTIEMGDVKFVIFERGIINYNILCDSIENETFLREIISKINPRLMAYITKKKIDIDSEVMFDSELNEVIDNIIDDILSDEFVLKSGEKIIEYMKELKLVDEINGTILLSDKGKVIFTSFNKIDLKIFLKEFDFRVKIYNNSILKLFYTFKDKRFIFSEYIQNKYFIILVFNSHVKFGVAECYLNKIAQSIIQIVSS